MRTVKNRKSRRRRKLFRGGWCSTFKRVFGLETKMQQDNDKAIQKRENDRINRLKPPLENRKKANAKYRTQYIKEEIHTPDSLNNEEHPTKKKATDNIQSRQMQQQKNDKSSNNIKQKVLLHDDKQKQIVDEISKLTAEIKQLTTINSRSSNSEDSLDNLENVNKRNKVREQKVESLIKQKNALYKNLKGGSSRKKSSRKKL